MEKEKNIESVAEKLAMVKKFILEKVFNEIERKQANQLQQEFFAVPWSGISKKTEKGIPEDEIVTELVKELQTQFADNAHRQYVDTKGINADEIQIFEKAQARLKSNHNIIIFAKKAPEVVKIVTKKLFTEGFLKQVLTHILAGFATELSTFAADSQAAPDFNENRLCQEVSTFIDKRPDTPGEGKSLTKNHYLTNLEIFGKTEIKKLMDSFSEYFHTGDIKGKVAKIITHEKGDLELRKALAILGMISNFVRMIKYALTDQTSLSPAVRVQMLEILCQEIETRGDQD